MRVRNFAAALILAMCIAFASCVTPTTSLVLVCNFTGQPMAPVFAGASQAATKSSAASGRHACCLVTIKQESGGLPHVAFVNPSCCHLKLVRSGGVFPTTLASTSDPSGYAVQSNAPDLVSPASSPIAVSLFPEKTAAPRGPPRFAAPPRAPPFFS